MDIQGIKAFMKVSESGSFSKAAASLHLTQPAISKRIATLESSLDTRLFDRIGKTVRLTEAGRALLPHTQRILLEIDESRRTLSHMHEYAGGKLRLGISHHIGLHRLPAVLRIYTSKYPGVDLDLNFMDSETAFLQVADGSIEMAIITLPVVAAKPLHIDTIWNDPMCCVVSADHPLASREKTSMKTLSDYPAILQTQNTNTRLLIDEAFVHHLPLNVFLETGYLETIKSMVSIGLGWSVLPETLIDGKLLKLDVAGLDVIRQLGVVTNASLTLSRSALSMIDILHSDRIRSS